MAASKISAVWAFFKDTYTGAGGLTQFRKEWEELSDVDKNQIRGGIESGTLTY